MKNRPARSFEKALVTIVSSLGDTEAARIVGRSPSLVRKWSDPDSDARPRLDQCLKLDMAYVSRTGLPAPIHGVYLRKLEEAYRTCDATVESPIVALFNRQASLGVASKRLADSVRAEGDGCELAIVERLGRKGRMRELLLQDIEAIAQELGDLERAVRTLQGDGVG